MKYIRMEMKQNCIDISVLGCC